MRKTLAVCCCCLAVAFGFVAGVAHVHDGGAHGEGSRGLHLGHGHLGGSTHPHSHHDHHHDSGPSHDHAHGMVRDHHHEDLTLSAAAVRSAGSSVRTAAAVLSAAAPFDAPAAGRIRLETRAVGLPDSPDEPPPRMRAPPA